MVAQGVSYIIACNEDEMLPPPETVRGWLVNNKEFRERYLDSYKVHLTLSIPEILDIADNANEKVGRSKLRVETRMKLLEKLDPGRFGRQADEAANPITEMFTFIRRQNV